MPGELKLDFAPIALPAKGVLVVFCEEGLKFGTATQKLLKPAGDLVTRAANADRFKGKNGATLDIVAPPGLDISRLIVVGAGKARDLKSQGFVKLGGVAMGKVPAAETHATIIADLPGALKPDQAADLALGVRLRAYRFDRYKTKRKEGEEGAKEVKVTIGVAGVGAVQKAYGSRDAVAGGVLLARDLVNEPANVLFPVEFARRASELKELGVAVEVFDVAEMKELGMHALLGVGQGSEHESRMVIMRWNGGKRDDKPIAFIGKGVCFDTGGISIKPAGGMEDMKWDMGGAGAVTGAMHLLAGRKARVNVVGVCALVENMPDGNAQRPGDVVKSMSGQTVEVINTDAEGRLILCDAMWYAQEKFKPQAMVELSTLTGAIIVSLGHERAGLFSNNTALSNKLRAAGSAIGEKLWRMPLGPKYDKLIDSDIADMKNVSNGRDGGSITAAQFLQRFVQDGVAWAHLDIAGVAWSKKDESTIPRGATAFGVRLLDTWIANNYER